MNVFDFLRIGRGDNNYFSDLKLPIIRFTVVWPNNGESYYGQFQIAEIVVISSADSQKIKDIQYYLSNKWGLGSHVDSDGDGFVDTIEIAENSDAKNTNSVPQNIPSVVGESELWP